MDKIKILVIAGSLREESFSKKTARFFVGLLTKKGVEAEFVDLRDLEIPVYDGDVQEKAFPKGAQALKDKIVAADAVLIVTPEYNHAPSGVLKNAINWSSRPYGTSAFTDKLVGMASISTGRIGGARALLDLRVSLAETGAWVMPNEVSIGMVDKLLGEDGQITDEQMKSVIDNLLGQLITWSERFRKIKNEG